MFRERKFVPTFINILLWIPLLLFALPAAYIVWLFKKCFEKIVVKYKPNLRPPQMMDVGFCQGNSYSLPNTNCAQVWVVSGKWITAEEFSSHFHRCFLEGNQERYRNLYAHVRNYGTYSFYSHCSPDELDLNWHIRELKVTDYGCGTLQSFAAVWTTTDTYERNRPVWQIAILHLGDNKNIETMETGIVAKFSHALVDGYSFVHMIGKLTNNPAPYNVPERIFSWKEKLRLIYEMPIDFLSFYIDMALSRESQSPFKSVVKMSNKSDDNSSQKWFMSLATLNLETIKKIRKSTDSRFICLMIAAQFGALRKLMLETQKEENLPKYLWIGSSLPWPGHPLKLTNHWTMGYFKCPFRTDNPMDRLRWVEAYYRKYRQMEYDTKCILVTAPVLRIMPTWARRFALQFVLKNVSLFFASLMLSSKKHHLLGREVKNLYLPLQCADAYPVAMYGVTTSHSGQLDLSISACKGIIKNQEELDRLTHVYFVEELNSIANLCGVPTVSDTVEQRTSADVALS